MTNNTDNVIILLKEATVSAYDCGGVIAMKVDEGYYYELAIVSLLTLLVVSARMVIAFVH
jgi:hypothetical protein